MSTMHERCVVAIGLAFLAMGCLPSRPVRIRTESIPEVFPGAGGQRIGIPVRVLEPYYVATASSDSPATEAMRLDLDPARDFTFGEPAYPEGGPLVIESTRKEIQACTDACGVSVPVQVAEGACFGQRVLTGRLRYQVCGTWGCDPPEEAPLELTVRIISETQCPRE